MLPLGLRVQDKIEKLIDKNMRAVGTISKSDIGRYLSTVKKER